MAKLPGFDSTSQMTTQPASVRRDMREEAQFGQDISTVGGAVQEVANVWQEAKNFSQKITAQNNLETQINDIVARAAADPDYNSAEKYQEELSRVGEKSLEGFSDNIARMEFSTLSNNQIAQANIKVNSIFRDKMIDHTRAEIITQHDLNKSAFIQTGDPAYQEKQLSVSALGFQKGFVSEEFLANEQIKVKDWEKMRYLQIAENDPSTAIELVKNSDMLPSEKSAALNNIKSIAEQKDIAQEIERSMRESESVEALRTTINDPAIPYVDKLNAIQQAERFGLPESTAKRMTQYLNSADKVNATSYDDQFSEALVMIGTLEEGIGKKVKIKDARQYMQKVLEARNYIIDQRISGNLTEQDEIDLTKKLNDTVKVEERYGLKKLEKQDEWFKYDYSEAKKDFLNMFGQNQLKADMAMREFFYSTEGKKLDKKQKKSEVSRIVDEINIKFRENTAKELESIKKATPATLSDEEIIKRAGFTEEDVQFTMQQTGKSRSEIINYLRTK
jgi:hypothetical protein